MLFSKDITSHTILPKVIRRNAAFQKQESFEKIFPKIGLPNFEKDIKEIKPSIKFIANSSLFGMKVNILGIGNSIITEYGWKILGTPLMFLDLMFDAYRLIKFKRNNRKEQLKVVFSSEDMSGAWDIATMSMRGISSCQSWGCGRACQLVGSIIDPCCAIMYITDGYSTAYGSEMMFRTIVRYVVHETFGPCLFMEQTYPSNYDEKVIRGVNLIFASELHARTNLPVFYDYCMVSNSSIHPMFIPLSKTVLNNWDYASYRDSGLEYKQIDQWDVEKFPSLSVFKEKFWSR